MTHNTTPILRGAAPSSPKTAWLRPHSLWLRQEGNAVDAAVATAACLTVVEPTSNGVGGDAFPLVWMKDRLYGLNSSGPAPMSLTLDTVLQKVCKGQLPNNGWLPVTVPGTLAAWAELVSRFGKLSLAEHLEGDGF